MEKTYQEPFRFQQFEVRHDRCSMKVGTDGVLLGAWAPLDGVQRALDIGTGSGVIAMMLAQRMDGGWVDGIDIEAAAAQQAKENMQACRWSAHLHAHHISLQDFAQTKSEPYDLIVSNPPFFTGGTLSDNMDRHAVRHAVKLSHGDLLQGVKRLLKPDGRFALILPLIEGMRFRELAATYGLFCHRCTEVRSRPSKPVERLLMCMGLQPADSLRVDELVLHGDDRQTRSPAYRELTGAFYLTP